MKFINQYKDQLFLVSFYSITLALVEFNNLSVMEYLFLTTTAAWAITWGINIYYDFQLKRIDRIIVTQAKDDINILLINKIHVILTNMLFLFYNTKKILRRRIIL